MEKIKKILENYNKKDYELFMNTIEVLCKKGIPNGAYQDYAMLADIVQILYIVADEILYQS